MNLVRFDGTRRELVATCRRVVDAAAGRDPAFAEYARGVVARIGVALLSQIQQDFVTKSRGGRGKDGVTWEPLKPETVARRRQGPKDRQAVSRELRALKARMYADEYGRLVLYLDAKEAKRMAAAAVKRRFPAAAKKAARAILAARTVDILRDTGALLRSLSPGSGATPSGAAGQVFELEPGAVTVGTREKPWHQDGIPGRLPKRPPLPPGGRLPDAYRPAVNGAAVRGLRDAFAAAAARGM